MTKTAPLVDAQFYASFTGTMPCEGCVVVLHYPDSPPGYQWHVALVEVGGFKKDCFVISERNLDGKGSYSERCIPYNHKSIVKFWRAPEALGRFAQQSQYGS